MKIHLLFVLLFCFFLAQLQANTFTANPDNYLEYINQLSPGDTVFLVAGDYYDRLNLDDITGTEEAPIVIMGPPNSNAAVFYGNACCNTISLERCAWLEIRYLTLDGQNIPNIDAVKAEGTTGNWTHHITIEFLTVLNHGGAPLTVGINTKCTSWDWTIRYNTFVNPGLGMYLGNSDGTAPFVNGIIEYNLVINPIRYGIQVKHQNVGTRNIEGMTLNGKTIIRYNTISKAENADFENSRPNLLVGNFPATGDGSNDHYEIYGNFLWQNPSEGLFQCTGNVAFYNNILVNNQPDGWGIFCFNHNGFQPRNILMFNNTILCTTEGIDIDNPDPDFYQLVAGNAIFAPTPLDISPVAATHNITDELENANNYVVNPNSGLPGLDLTPLEGPLIGTELDYIPFLNFGNYTFDFDGNSKGWAFRGAYAKVGAPAWALALELRSEVFGTTSSFSEIGEEFKIVLYPNPADREIILQNDSQLDILRIDLFDFNGKLIRTVNISAKQKQTKIDLVEIQPGPYIVSLQLENSLVLRRIIVL